MYASGAPSHVCCWLPTRYTVHLPLCLVVPHGIPRLMATRDVRVLSAAAAEPYKAVVFGSTGAVGKEVVRALAESEQCQSIVAIVR